MKIATKDINDRDRRWIDIGSGIMSKTFVGVDKLITTSRGGPRIVDILYRKIWSPTASKLLNECDIDDVPVDEPNRKLPEKDSIRVEVTLRNALALFEKRHRRGGGRFTALGMPEDWKPEARRRSAWARLELRLHNE